MEESHCLILVSMLAIMPKSRYPSLPSFVRIRFPGSASEELHPQFFRRLRKIGQNCIRDAKGIYYIAPPASANFSAGRRLSDPINRMDGRSVHLKCKKMGASHVDLHGRNPPPTSAPGCTALQPADLSASDGVNACFSCSKAIWKKPPLPTPHLRAYLLPQNGQFEKLQKEALSIILLLKVNPHYDGQPSQSP